MNTSIDQSEQQHIAPDEAHVTPRMVAVQVGGSGHSNDERVRELAVWLDALQSFFRVPNYPLSNKDQVAIFTRDWTNEVRIVCAALAHTTHLTLSIVETEGANNELIEDQDDGTTSGLFSVVDSIADNGTVPPNNSVLVLSEVLTNALTICEELLETRGVNFNAWNAIGKTIEHELDGLDVARMILKTSQQQDSRIVQSLLSVLTHNSIDPNSLGADMLSIVSELYLLLQRLRPIEDALRLDHPLKMMLPVFTLVHEEGRNLVRLIGSRALRTGEWDQAAFEVLDGTSYAVAMELRKVYAQELVGLSSLRQAPPVYARIENAHGLLRDCFQQSIVALVQLFDPALDGSNLFYFFQTKLQQSLALRQDLWTLLLHVQRAERERDSYPLSRLLERLTLFLKKACAI